MKMEIYVNGENIGELKSSFFGTGISFQPGKKKALFHLDGEMEVTKEKGAEIMKAILK